MKIIVTESQLDRALSESPNEVKALINPTQPFDMGSMEKFRKFGWRWGRAHNGIDIKADYVPAYAIADGVVKVAKFKKGACGGTIVVQYDNGYRSSYCHMSKISVSKGETVTQGQNIGTTGGKKGSYGAGNSSGAHLHFGLKYKGKWVDPLKYLDTKNIVLDKTDEEITKTLPTGALTQGDGYVSRQTASSKVEEMQSDLMRRNYVLPKFGVDGKFGPETLKAVNLFQKDHGFEVSEIVTAQMLTALKDESKVNEKPELNDKNKEEEVEKEIAKTNDNVTLKV